MRKFDEYILNCGDSTKIIQLQEIPNPDSNIKPDINDTIILSSDTFRENNFQVSKSLSWEKSILQICKAILKTIHVEKYENFTIYSSRLALTGAFILQEIKNPKVITLYRIMFVTLFLINVEMSLSILPVMQACSATSLSSKLQLQNHY